LRFDVMKGVNKMGDMLSGGYNKPAALTGGSIGIPELTGSAKPGPLPLEPAKTGIEPPGTEPPGLATPMPWAGPPKGMPPDAWDWLQKRRRQPLPFEYGIPWGAGKKQMY
jgi:hypothetical protein